MILSGRAYRFRFTANGRFQYGDDVTHAMATLQCGALVGVGVAAEVVEASRETRYKRITPKPGDPSRFARKPPQSWRGDARRAAG